jgi:hypothetical protein
MSQATPILLRSAVRRWAWRAAVPAILAALVGCDATASTPAPEGRDRLKVLGRLYGRLVAQQQGQAPANEAALLAFLERERASWEGFGLTTPQELIASPRDGQPLRVIYRGAPGAESASGTPYACVEQAGADGIRWAATIRGSVDELDDAQFQQLFGPQQ